MAWQGEAALGEGIGPNGLRLCWGWRGEHGHCSLLAPLKVHFIPDLDTELPQTCLGAMRGCWGWAGCCFWGVVGNISKPRAALGPALYCKTLYPGKSVSLGWTIPDFKKQSMTHSLQQVSTSCKPREAEMGFLSGFYPTSRSHELPK